MTRPIILTDADNTLWDTDATFAQAQLGLLREVEASVNAWCQADDKLAFVRHYDQALAALHHAHLKYPPSMLVSALALGLSGVHWTDAAETVIRGRLNGLSIQQHIINSAVEEYLAVLNGPPPLLPTVVDGLQRARAAGITICVLTEGTIEKQRKIISHHSLDKLIDMVLEVLKNRSQYERLRKRFSPAESIVIGDQPDRDIAPARAAGCIAILVPSRFRPHWHDDDEYKNADYVATTFAEGVEWIIKSKLCHGGGAS